MKQNIEHLIKKAVELEGLLYVLNSRETNEIKTLLIEKYSEFTEEFDNLIENIGEKAPEVREEEANLFNIAENEEVKLQEAEDGEVVDEMDASVEAVERGAADEANDMAEVELLESENGESPNDDTESAPASEKAQVLEVPFEEETNIEAEVEDAAPEYPEHEITSELKVDQMLSRKEAADLKRVFTLNDKFRFRRALFNQDDTKFAEALQLLGEIKSFDEAKKMLETRYGWDMTDPEVEDFLSIIEPHYS